MLTVTINFAAIWHFVVVLSSLIWATPIALPFSIILFASLNFLMCYFIIEEHEQAKVAPYSPTYAEPRFDRQTIESIDSIRIELDTYLALCPHSTGETTFFDTTNN